MAKKQRPQTENYVFRGYTEVAPDAWKQVWDPKKKLATCKATYDPSSAIITIEETVMHEGTEVKLLTDVKLEPGSKQSALAEAIIFKRPVGVYVSWDELYEAITGDEVLKADEGQKRMVMDAAKGINEKVREIFGTDDELLERNNLSIRRVI